MNNWILFLYFLYEMILLWRFTVWCQFIIQPVCIHINMQYIYSVFKNIFGFKYVYISRWLITHSVMNLSYSSYSTPPFPHRDRESCRYSRQNHHHHYRNRHLGVLIKNCIMCYMYVHSLKGKLLPSPKS